VLTLSKFSYFFEEVEYNHNQFLYKIGDTSSHIYVVREGEFEVSRKHNIRKDKKVPAVNKLVSHLEKLLLLSI